MANVSRPVSLHTPSQYAQSRVLAPLNPPAPVEEKKKKKPVEPKKKKPSKKPTKKQRKKPKKKQVPKKSANRVLPWM